jgi:chromosome segregation ATPase
MRGRRAAARELDARADLARRLGEAERLVSELRSELERLNQQTLEVARQFESEAAARAEAEAVAELLRREHAQLLAEADELRTRLARAPSGAGNEAQPE